MHRLILLRHAKAEGPLGRPDLDRPLAERGRKDALRVGAFLARERLRPDHVVVSPSRRTLETWEGVGKAFENLEAETVGALYNASTYRIFSAIHAAPDDAASLLVIGHNPGIAEIAIQLAGSGTPAARTEMRESFPTAAFAVIDFDVERWSDVARGSGRLQAFVTPRAMQAADRR